MSAKKIYDVAVKTRSYTDRNGEDGNSWLTISRWFNPAGIPVEEGRDTISCSLFTPKPADGGPL